MWYGEEGGGVFDLSLLLCGMVKRGGVFDLSMLLCGMVKRGGGCFTFVCCCVVW